MPQGAGGNTPLKNGQLLVKASCRIYVFRHMSPAYSVFAALVALRNEIDVAVLAKELKVGDEIELRGTKFQLR